MKRRLLIITISLLFVAGVQAQSKVIADLINLRSDKGVCRICVFNSAASFKGKTGKPVECLAVPVKNKTAQAIFNNLPAGTYAVFVFHDENSNNKMDTNFLGIPKEGYGASKNKLPFASAPTFEDNKFSLENGTAFL